MATTNGTLKYKQDDGSIVELNPVGVDSTARAEIEKLTTFPNFRSFLHYEKAGILSGLEFTPSDDPSGYATLTIQNNADDGIMVIIPKPYPVSITGGTSTPFDITMSFDLQVTLANGNKGTIGNQAVKFICTRYVDSGVVFLLWGHITDNMIQVATIDPSHVPVNSIDSVGSRVYLFTT